jgi:hypothetical protein
MRKNALAVAFLSTGSCHNRGENIGSKFGLGQKSREPGTFGFRYEPFRPPKTALLDRFHLRDLAHINSLFSYLQEKPQVEMGTLPPFFM